MEQFDASDAALLQRAYGGAAYSSAFIPRIRSSLLGLDMAKVRDPSITEDHVFPAGARESSIYRKNVKWAVRRYREAAAKQKQQGSEESVPITV